MFWIKIRNERANERFQNLFLRKNFLLEEDIKGIDDDDDGAYFKDKRWFFEPRRIELCDCVVCVCVRDSEREGERESC